MYELVIKKSIDAIVPWCKDLVEQRVRAINEARLKKKIQNSRASKKTRLNADELARIKLDNSETIQGDFRVRGDDVIALLKIHLDEVERWSTRVKFEDMPEQRRLQDIYVELDTYLMPSRTHLHKSERVNIRPLQEAVFGAQSHCVVLGQPGAGKTTSMQKLCSRFFDGQKPARFQLPILVRFRALTFKDDVLPIRNYLTKIIPYELKLLNSSSSIEKANIAEDLSTDVFCTLLDKMDALIILEGFDEIPSQLHKSVALEEIRLLCANLESSKVVITCRSGEFNYSVDNATVFEIAPLTPQQILTFANRWIRDPTKVDGFLDSIRRSPFADTSIKPLSLAHLCAIYERTGSIPDKPKTVYRKVVTLLISDWDDQRSIARETKYSKFEPDRKFDFLAQIAFHLTITVQAPEFDERALESAYLKVCENFDLPRQEHKKVARELESHTGLLLEVGFRTYSFAHKSLQEYLAAEYLVRLPALHSVRKHAELLGSELAIATALSSNPSLYFSEIILGMFGGEGITRSFYDAFMSRMLQEKPDFYSCEEMVLAIFTLISIKSDHSPYAEFMRDMLQRSKVEWIFSYYEPTQTTREAQRGSGSASSILILARIRHHATYKLKQKLEFNDLEGIQLVLDLFTAYQKSRRLK